MTLKIALVSMLLQLTVFLSQAEEGWMIPRLLYLLTQSGEISARLVVMTQSERTPLYADTNIYKIDQSYASAIHSQGNKLPYLNQQQQQAYGRTSSPGHQRAQTFEEIEAELQRTAGYRSQLPPMSGDHEAGMMSGQAPGKKMLTMAEVEAALLAKGSLQTAGGQFPQQGPPQQQPPYGYVNLDPAQMMALRQQQELIEQMSAEKELMRREQMRQHAEKVKV
jgi:hypothetical protein